MVVQANRNHSGLGGHIASFASGATLFDVGFNHFFRASSDGHDGDLIFFQGHSAPGIYARAYLEGRISEAQLLSFRQETGGKGLASYPHPWLMPGFWQFPTVSMGLTPMMAIAQARFMRYLDHRDILDTGGRKVWAFLGDGEMDEPESLGSLSLAARERLDNLIFVVNCNLQRLDGPVRGNGKIIQELEAVFRGAGWNVIKVIWGSNWDPLLVRDSSGLLRQRMQETVDGDYQAYAARGGAYTREHFFGKYPELAEMVANMTDEDIWRLDRGGHDPHKIYAAYAEAVAHEGQPTVILAKTVKGYGMGEAGEGRNITHQQKKMGGEALKHFRDRFNLPIDDDRIAEAPFYKPAEDSPEIRYLKRRREELGGFLPIRRTRAEPLAIPDLAELDLLLKGTEDRAMSTTMAFGWLLATLCRNKKIGKLIVPIIPDEARTFGLEGLFRQLGIYSPAGQLYEPVDRDQVMYYKEDEKGQLLEEGINEAGALCSWMAAGTAYSNHGINMIPFYIFYSMFGFQRVGDFVWAAGDMQVRGFLLGGTSGAYHPRRGRPAAPGRTQSSRRCGGAQLPALRSNLRLRACRHRPGRIAPHVRRAGKGLLLHYGDERKLCPSPDADGCRRRDSEGYVSFRARQPRTPAARAIAGLGHDTARGHRGRPAARGGLRRRGRCLERTELHPAAA